MKPKTCFECGVTFTPREEKALFCSPTHRKDWGNRRMVRGAKMFDLIMSLRYERAAATEAEAWKALCRLAAEYRDEDVRERDGRFSWYRIGSPRHILARLPYLLADTLSTNLLGRKKT